MRIVRIKGGLGNQLFQYSFALSLHAALHEDVKLDFLSCRDTKDITCRKRLQEFELSLGEATRKDIKSKCLFVNGFPLSSLPYRITSMLSLMLDKHYYFEKTREFKEIKDIQNYNYYDGYWQSWRYPYAVKHILDKELIPTIELGEKTKKAIEIVSSENSVFIGIRRGDYSSSSSTVKRFGSFSNDYFLNAIERIKQTVDSPVFYVFSNDIEWCKKNLNWGNNNIVFREREDQVSDFEELMIMSNCKHAVIINSTFHWWGAFLIRNENKIIIAPDKWYADGDTIDIIPPEWIRMSRNGEIEE